MVRGRAPRSWKSLPEIPVELFDSPNRRVARIRGWWNASWKSAALARRPSEAGLDEFLVPRNVNFSFRSAVASKFRPHGEEPAESTAYTEVPSSCEYPPLGK